MQKQAKWKKAVTKIHVSYDPISIDCPEPANA